MEDLTRLSKENLELETYVERIKKAVANHVNDNTPFCEIAEAISKPRPMYSNLITEKLALETENERLVAGLKELRTRAAQVRSDLIYKQNLEAAIDWNYSIYDKTNDLLEAPPIDPSPIMAVVKEVCNGKNWHYGDPQEGPMASYDTWFYVGSKDKPHNLIEALPPELLQVIEGMG